MSSQFETPQFETPQSDAADQPAPGDGTHPDDPSGPPYRAIAMVLLAAVVVAVGVGLAQLFGGGDDPAPSAGPETTVQETPAPTSPDEQQGQPVESGQPGQPAEGATAPAPEGTPPLQPPGQPALPPVTAVPVQIFNNSTVTGLAGRTGERLRESGFAVGDVANLPSDQPVVAESTAYFGTGPGEQQAAEAIAAQLGIPAKPRPATMAVTTPGVVVIVTQDLAR